MTLSETISKLEKLEKEATPGPWMSDAQSPRLFSDSDGAWLGNTFGPSESTKFSQKDASSNSEFIATVRNELPALLDAIKKMREALERIEFSRGTNAGSINAHNYTIARECLEELDK